MRVIISINTLDTKSAQHTLFCFSLIVVIVVVEAAVVIVMKYSSSRNSYVI